MTRDGLNLKQASAATAVRNNREGSGAIWLLGDNGAINVRLRRKNPDCCLNCKLGGFLVLYEQEMRERDYSDDEKRHDNCFG